jgi:hypothetical protein
VSQKKSSSRLFKGSPNQLLLDERVSKIALPTLDDNRVVMDEREANWGLKTVEEEERPAEALQIFVGIPTLDTTSDSSPSSWDISEDDDPFWDESIDDDLEVVPTPMALSFNTSLSTLAEEVKGSDAELSMLPGIPLQPIQEIQKDESLPFHDGDEDDWAQINWDDVTLSDILGGFDELDEELDDEFDPDSSGAKIDLGFDMDSVDQDEMEETEVFPTLVTIEDAPSWEDAWEQEDTDPVGPSLNLDEDWFSEAEHATDTLPILQMEDSIQHHPSYTTSNRRPPPRIVIRQPKSLWDDTLVKVWLMILGLAFFTALLWRFLQD